MPFEGVRERGIMHWYRRFLLLSDAKKHVYQALMLAVIGLLSKGCHDGLVHDPAATAEYQGQLAQRWLDTKNADPTSQIARQRGRFIKEIIQSCYGVTVAINDKTCITVDLGTDGRLTMPGQGVTHVCVKADYKTRQVYICFPKNRADLVWLDAYPTPTQAMYVREGETILLSGILPVNLYEPYEYTSNEDLATVTLSVIAAQSTRFNDEMQATAARLQWLRYIDAYLHSSFAHVIVYLLVVLVVCLPNLDRGIKGMAEQAADAHGLDAPALQRISEAIRPDWLSGKPRGALRKRLEALARVEVREKLAAEKRERSKQLRMLADEARARKLEELAAKQARQAAERITTQQSTLSREIAKLRLETESETSAIGRVLESDFISRVRDEIDEAQSPPEKQTPSRQKLISAISGCTRELTGVSGMTDGNLAILAEIIRPMKRHLSREAFRAFVEQFDGVYDKSFQQIFEYAQLELYEELERFLLHQPEFSTSSAEIPLKGENLLQGKRVLLVGGIASLSGFYTEHLQKIGAGSVIHVPDESANRMQKCHPDIVLLLWRRCSHKQQDLAKSLGVPVVYVDRVTRSTFPRSVSESIRVQAPPPRAKSG